MSRNFRSPFKARRTGNTRASERRTGSAPRGKSALYGKRAWFSPGDFLRDALSDSLREHLIFSLEDERSSPGESGVVEVAALTEAARERLYCEQWLRLYRVRLQLTASIGIVCLMLFISFYFVLFPPLDRRILVVSAVTIAGLSTQIAFIPRIRSLGQMRALTLAAFALFAASSALVLALVSAPPDSPYLDGAHAVQFVIAASFAHILLTSLVLPLRLSDTLSISIIVVGALMLGLRASPALMRTVSPAGALWVAGTIALFTTLLAHFNSQLRRRVFDSAFDLALQALKLKAISETDSLTQGFNRRHCQRVLANELVRAARFARPLSLLMFDLDNFKPVNDTLGHAAGDRVLIAVHQAANAELREVDDLSRIGGDEFLILLPETDHRQARRIARRLHARVARELELRFGKGSLLGCVTISMGALTLETGHNFNVNGALQRVDELLYDAKYQGKNRVVQNVEGG